MPRLSFKAAQARQTLGPLAAATEFQVRYGSVVVTTEDQPTNPDWGFTREALGPRDSFRIGAGKMVYLTTTTHATVHYEVLE